MNLTNLSMYELLKNEELPEINSTGYYFKHKKSGAKLAVLENDDRNKVFCISFRTPPNNDTGVAHIIEHSVLMGSEKYPLKDPFNKLASSSLNTYLNAMTYPDKTMYPIASCNDKDFKNLMGVYADAVFAPNVIKDDRAFRQEGWSYQLDSEDDELKYNGVVYNEMKGAYSSSDRVTSKEMMAAIFPDTNYAFESGGKPEAITDLSYEEFVGFYNKLYHPSNSYIYLYGDADMEERLLWLDKEYLCKYEKIDVDDTMPLLQKTFDGLREKRCTYSIMENEDEKDKTNLGFAVAFDGYCEDTKFNLALQLLSYALVEAPGSPLEKALYDAGIGKLVYGDVDGMRQGYFEIVANNTNEDRKDEFYRVIMDALKDVVNNGIDKKTLRAGLHNMEFKYREQDFGRWPGGLLICIGMMQSWLYNDDKVFDFYKLNDVFAELRELIDTDYYEKLVDRYFVNNPHAVLLTVAPERGLIGKKEKELKDKLLTYQNSLTNEEKKEIVWKTKELKEYQDEEDTPEALATLPRLFREDIDPKAHSTTVVEKSLSDGTKLLHSDLSTNGIGYLKLLFNTDLVPERLVKYLPFLSYIGKLDTAKHNYAELRSEILCSTGGISMNFSKYGSANNDKDYTTAIVVSARALYDKLPFAVQMIEELVFDTDWTNDKRIQEVLAENITGLEKYLNNSPHNMVYIRGLLGITPEMAYRELTENITHCRFLKELSGNYKEHRDEFIRNINELIHMVFRPENLMVHFCGNDEGVSIIEAPVCELKKKFFTDDVEKIRPVFNFDNKDEGIKMASQVQYVGRFGNYRREGYDYSGVLQVAKNILDSEYLYQNIRAKGGAYGIFAIFSRNGNMGFISYRDPKLEETNKVYDGISDYLRNFEATEEEMTEYIIGVIGALDIPYTPSGEAQRALDNYMSGLTHEMIQRSRDEILSTTAEDVRGTADLIEAVLNNSRICVAGNDEKIDGSTLFERKISVERD